jgi:hypothetical protein
LAAELEGIEEVVVEREELTIDLRAVRSLRPAACSGAM